MRLTWVEGLLNKVVVVVIDCVFLCSYGLLSVAITVLLVPITVQ